MHRIFLTAAAAALFLVSGCGGGGGGGSLQIEAVAAGRQFPVKMAFAPDGRLFFTELATGAVFIVEDDTVSEQPFAVLPVPAGSGNGLTGIAIDPNFGENGYVYLYHTAPDPMENRLVRYTERDGVGVDPRLILGGISVGEHNGGALEFGPDGRLYLGTGDAGMPQLAQNQESASGKILRLNADGSVPDDNPVAGSLVFASGFRNVFGLSFDPAGGAVFASDNGPNCDDEINSVERGGNYGWRPDQPCGDTDAAFREPLIRLNPSAGPTGLLFYTGAEFPELRGSLLYGEFNSGTIRRFRLSPDGELREEEPLFAGGLGGILGLAEDGRGRIYFTTPDAIHRISR